MATSYNRWPASSDPNAIGIDRAFTACDRRFPGGVRSGDVAVVMRYLVERLDAAVEDVDLYEPGDEWGYHYRANRNDPSQLSCHASGTAVDFNATRHPNGKGGTWTTAQRSTIAHICNVELEQVVRNLTGYDEMHFEICDGATAVKRVADKIRRGQAPTPTQENDVGTLEGRQATLLDNIHAALTGRTDPNYSLDDIEGLSAQMKMLRRNDSDLAAALNKIGEHLGLGVLVDPGRVVDGKLE